MYQKPNALYHFMYHLIMYPILLDENVNRDTLPLDAFFRILIHISE